MLVLQIKDFSQICIPYYITYMFFHCYQAELCILVSLIYFEQHLLSLINTHPMYNPFL